jgi:arginase
MLYVPYHLADHHPDLNAPLPSGFNELSMDLPDGDVWTRLAHLYEAVAVAVGQAEPPPVVVSGDCMHSIGITAGLQRAGMDPGIVWFDAHGDVQTLETTTSGYLGGMALRLLLGYRPELVAERIGLRPLAERRAMLVDARDLDPPEQSYLASSDVRRSSVAELSADDLPDRRLILHIDLDVVDPEVLPGLRYPAPGGPSPDSVLTAARTVMSTGRVAALHVACCWQPGGADPTGVRARLISSLAEDFRLLC